jgi:hypothetical protein
MISFNRSILTCILASILSNATHAFDISFQTKGSRTTEKNEFELQINHHGDIRDSIFRTSNTVSFDLPTEESIVKFLMRKTSAPNHGKVSADLRQTTLIFSYLLMGVVSLDHSKDRLELTT